jgi:hypothetical protein
LLANYPFYYPLLILATLKIASISAYTGCYSLLVNGASTSAVFSHCLEDMTGYLRGRNSVESVPFQVSQVFPQPRLPLHQQIAPADLHEIIKRQPTATLCQLCELVSRERGIRMSTTAMCRLVKRYQILRRRPGIPQSVDLRLAA